MRLLGKILGFTLAFSILSLSAPQWKDGIRMGTFSFSKALAQEYLEAYPEREPFAEEPVAVRDPLEPLNRAFFKFNDRLYFWFLKPVATVYAAFIPCGVRTGINNAFKNVLMPVRVVNTILQGKPRETGIELSRFLINSTLGVGGFFDFAKTQFNLNPHNEDFGQTLGVYGMGQIIYINWPVFGPSSVRDSIGLVGDGFLNPIFYLSPSTTASVAIKTGKETNDVSLTIGEYEDFLEASLDPYIAMRDGYLQYRENQVRQ